MSIIDDLRQALGEAAVLTGSHIGARYRSDASDTGAASPLALIRPRTTEDVSAALRLYHAAGVPVIAQGGMTGLAGAGNPSGHEVAISLELLRGIEDVDLPGATMTVKAGTPLEECQRVAEDAGLFLALDLGARGSCQIGGNLSTNAGGIRVIRYGMAREQVLGLEAVLADGTIVSNLNKMLKNNAGYDLKQLFIGSEGTLGIITRAVLRLHPPLGEIQTVLCALESYADVVTLLRRAQGELGSVVAFEALWCDYFSYVAKELGLTFFDAGHGFWVILETTEPRQALEAFLGACLEDGLVHDAVIAASSTQARDIWSVREGLIIGQLPDLATFDVSLPIARIGEFAKACEAVIRARWPEAHTFFFGHIGDSNLHICTSVRLREDESAHMMDAIVYDVVKTFGGSISAEHGIGTLKRDYLHFSRTPEEIALMRRLKAALDPKGILNPGKVI